MTVLYLLEIACVCALAIPALRELWIIQVTPAERWPRGVRRPFLAKVMVCVVPALLLAFLWPPGLHVLAALSVVWIVRREWQAAPWHGRKAGHPPGSLRPMPIGLFTSDSFYLDLQAKHGPIFKLNLHGLPAVCIIGHRRALALFRDHGPRIARPPMPFNQLLPRGFLRFMSPADRARYRGKLTGLLQRSIVGAHAPNMKHNAQAALARMAETTQRAGSVAPIAALSDYVHGTFAPLFFGVDPDDAAFTTLLELNHALCIEPAFASATPPKVAAFEALSALLLRQIEQLSHQDAATTKGHAASSAPAPSFLQKCIDDDLAFAQDPAVQANLIYIFHTGAIDVSALLVWIVKFLGDHPEYGDRVRSQTYDALDVPTAVSSGLDLAECIVLETLRLEQSEHILCKTIEPIQFEGFTIPRNWLLRIGIREAHRDPSVFENPEVFHPERFLKRKFSQEEFAPFGLGDVRCIGRTLAIQVASTFVRELCLGYEWQTIADGPRECGPHHWRPSSQLRIAVRPATAAVLPG